MTRDEIGDMIAALPQGLEPDDLIYRLVNWAVDKEREACAKLCEAMDHDGVMIAADCAKAIRARGIDVAKVGEVGVWGDKREWVGLTDEEIYDYADKFLYQHGSNYGIRSFGKAIEAKLKEKNT